MSANEFGKVGVDPATEDIIRRAFPEYPKSWIEQQFADPQTAILAALLREELGHYGAETPEKEARYYADEYTVTASGPRQSGTEPRNVNGKRIDFQQVVSAVDLRFDAAISVSFKRADSEHRQVTYLAADSPVVGIPVETRYMWVERADEASANAALQVEAWN